jgi:hypothetical protein
VAGNLTDTAENLAMDWLMGTGTPTRPTTPLKLALMTTGGSDSANGTEVTGGSYVRQTLTVGASAGGAVANTADVTFAGMPACTVVATEVWNSDGTVRIWQGPLAASKSPGSGDTVKFLTGELDFTFD